MRFHTFEVSVIDQDYDQADTYGNPTLVERPRHKICINVNDISLIEQIGSWVRINNTPPTRSRTATSRTLSPPIIENRDNFVIDPTRFTIKTKKGNVFQVAGSFDEFAQILSQFQDDREVV